MPLDRFYLDLHFASSSDELFLHSKLFGCILCDVERLTLTYSGQRVVVFSRSKKAYQHTIYIQSSPEQHHTVTHAAICFASAGGENVHDDY